tara:strand:+ start:584 stop:1018 length:435 start_codon:yes stop_codon:yes gene_type:complete
MKINSTALPWALLASLALPTVSFAAVSFAAQDIDSDDPTPTEINPFREAQEVSPQQRMIELFHEVEGNLNGATNMLFNAAQGDLSALDAIDGAGIEDIEGDENPNASGSRGSLASLLTATSAEGESVLSGIDAIIKLAEESGGT